MGIDIHGLKFLQHVADKKPFGATITIGRQVLSGIETLLPQNLQLLPDTDYVNYCENLLLGHFGAGSVDSMDNSDYENATIIHDMNKPVPSPHVERFDTVIDCGSLEHIFNLPQALKNVSQLCKQGGQIIHVLPANNFCGHGFWQFSPELFFSLYAEQNGYKGTEIYMADLTQTDRWFRVEKPENGRRVNVSSSTHAYVLVRTIRKNSKFSHDDVQQSDYVYEWENGAVQNDLMTATNRSNLRQSLKTLLQESAFGRKLYQLHLQSRSISRLNDKNPGLVRVKTPTLRI